MLETYCVKASATPLTLIHFLKMQADIYRYMAEITIKYIDIVNLWEVLPNKYMKEKGVEDTDDPKVKITDALK